MKSSPPPKGGKPPSEPFVADFSEGLETGLYLALLELIDEGLIITGDETIIEVNSAACRLLERDYRQLAGKPLADVFPSERAFLDARARLLIQGEMRGSLTVSLPGGRHRALRFIAAARIRPGIHALILSPDLIAETYAERPRGDTLWARLAALIDQPVIVLDADARVTAANATALRTLGLKREALVGTALTHHFEVQWQGTGEQRSVDLRATTTAIAPAGRSLHANVLPGPKPGWQVLVVPASGRPTPTTASTSEPADGTGSPRPGPSAASTEVATSPLRHDPSGAAAPTSPDDEFQALITAAARAIDLNQLGVHFQPLVDARTGTLRSGEALLRWQHPTLGLLPFNRFLAPARQGGLIARMGEWILNAACRYAAGWPRGDGRGTGLTVNVAAEQVFAGDLVDKVRKALSMSGLDPLALELDIEEAVLASGWPDLAPTLSALRALGVRLAVDGYGHGLSAIRQLKQCPFGALKLDPELVSEVGHREDSEAVIEAIAGMGGILGLEVLARGVETRAQQAFLSALGCHLQQGPLFGPPMSARDFRALLTGNQHKR